MQNIEGIYKINNKDIVSNANSVKVKDDNLVGMQPCVNRGSKYKSRSTNGSISVYVQIVAYIRSVLGLQTTYVCCSDCAVLRRHKTKLRKRLKLKNSEFLYISAVFCQQSDDTCFNEANGQYANVFIAL